MWCMGEEVWSLVSSMSGFYFLLLPCVCSGLNHPGLTCQILRKLTVKLSVQRAHLDPKLHCSSSACTESPWHCLGWGPV